MSPLQTKYIDKIIPIFDNVFKNIASGQKVTQQSCYIVSGIIDRHHCARDIHRTNFHLIPI